MEPLNPHFPKKDKTAEPDLDALFDKLKKGDRGALARALTLSESKLEKHRKQANQLIHKALPLLGNAIRIGITGVPGVGKSTFIEALGSHLTSLGKKVAVLAVDPSSSRSGGSILGDKTRMNKLSQDENAFVRPSPTGGSLGGVARKTRESILLCETAGYEVIIVETVGVGQSETTVKNITDFFILLMLAGAGDELQGIKRGIMEMADLLLINKADGENAPAAKRAKAEYTRALHLFPPQENGWIPKTAVCSALENQGIADVWETVQSFENQQKTNGHFEKNRQRQALHWFEEALGELVMQHFRNSEKMKKRMEEMRGKILRKEMEAWEGAKKLVWDFFESPF